MVFSDHTQYVFVIVNGNTEVLSNFRHVFCGWISIAICYCLVFTDKQNTSSELVLVVSSEPGHVAQSVTCLATDASLIADPGVLSSILAWSHTYMKIDYEIISTVILFSSAESFSYKRKFVPKYWLTSFSNLPRKKVSLGELTIPP